MRNISTKVNNGGATADGRLEASEYNDVQLDIENGVIRSGQTLSAADTLQMGRQSFLNAVGAQSFIDSGSANAIVLTPTTGASGYVMAENYTQLNGAKIICTVAAANTGAVTVNIGQTAGTLLGVKSLVDIKGAALTSGFYQTGDLLELQFSTSLDKFILINNLTNNARIAHANCRLSLVSGSLKLTPHNGNQIVINGVTQTIPSAGVTLAPPATTLINYFIYVYMNAGVMTLEYSATGHSTDANTGVEIKTADATRTLVGQARTVASAWVDTTNQRFVRSWFNSESLKGSRFVQANRTTASSTPTETDAADRCEFLVWAGETVMLSGNGHSSVNAVPAGIAETQFLLYLDGTTLESTSNVQFSTIGYLQGMPAPVTEVTGLSEGHHYVSPFISVIASGSCTGTYPSALCSVAVWS